MYNPINKYMILIVLGVIAMLILMTITGDILRDTAANALGQALENS